MGIVGCTWWLWKWQWRWPLWPLWYGRLLCPIPIDSRLISRGGSLEFFWHCCKNRFRWRFAKWWSFGRGVTGQRRLRPPWMRHWRCLPRDSCCRLGAVEGLGGGRLPLRALRLDVGPGGPVCCASCRLRPFLLLWRWLPLQTLWSSSRRWRWQHTFLHTVTTTIVVHGRRRLFRALLTALGRRRLFGVLTRRK